MFSVILILFLFYFYSTAPGLSCVAWDLLLQCNKWWLLGVRRSVPHGILMPGPQIELSPLHCKADS